MASPPVLCRVHLPSTTAIALGIVATNFPDQRFGALILLYVIVNAVIGIPYVRWQKRQVTGVVPAGLSDIALWLRSLVHIRRAFI
jgi:hypothetical protein